MNKKNVLISACLMGVNCRYDGKGILMEHLDQLMERYHLVPVCPEIMGGMTIPRRPCEKSGDRVVNDVGEDVTEYFVKGADEVIKLAGLYHCKYAILKERSPSCGYGEIYDGTFSHNVISGHGILGELLDHKEIAVYGETDMDRFLRDSK